MRYRIAVKFNEDFVKVDGDIIEVGVKSKPEKGKANIEIIKKLAEHFNKPSSNVRIVAGARSKNKIVEVI